MTIAVNQNDPRVSYSVSQGQTTTSFAVTFEFFADADLKVYVDDVLKTITTHYTVSGGNGSTGTVTMSVTGATGGSTVVITRDIALERTTDFPSSGAFNISTLNTELDRLVAIDADRNDTLSRSIRLQDQDASASMELPLKASRVGTVLGFNATTGAAEAGPTITAVQSLADVTTSINLLGTSAVVEDMGLLATSAVIEDMGLLATSGNITAMGLLGVSSVITDMSILGTSAIVEDMGFLGTSANVTAMGHLGTSANVTAMGKLGNDATVADMAILGTDDVVADMNTLANSSIVDDLNILATSDIVTDMALLATSANVTAMGHLGTSANVTAMGLLGTSAVVTDMGLLGTSAVVTDMDLLATSSNITNMATLGASGVVSNIATVSGAVTNVNTVATNVSGVNSFAERYRIASSAPTSSLDVGDLYFDTTANELKVYKSSGWAAAGSTVNGTSARFTYTISGTPTAVTGSDANGNTLAYDAGFIDVYLNGVKMLNGTDVTVTSGDTVTFASALANGDLVDIVAFGTFTVANITSTGALNSGSITSGFGNIDTGSSTITTTGAISGGTLTGTLQTASQTNITSVGALNAGSITSGFGNINNGSSTITTTGAISGGSLTANGGVTVDNITIDGTEIDLSSGDLTIDVAGDISLDADGGDINFKDGGVQFGSFTNASTDFRINVTTADKDIIFQGVDDSSTIEAMRIDMSAGGRVGIGTTSPQSNLHVTGTAKVATGNSQGILGLGEGNGTTVNVGLWRGAANAPTSDGNFLNLGGYDGIVFATGNAAIGSQTEHMRIDVNGHVTKPLNPAFLSSGAMPTNGEIATGVSNMTFMIVGSERFDKNNDYNDSTGIFTAPVAGVYQFHIQIFFTGSVTNAHLALAINNDTSGGGGGYVSNNAWYVVTANAIQGTWLANLSASDTARPLLHGDINNVDNTHLRQFFHGYLVG